MRLISALYRLMPGALGVLMLAFVALTGNFGAPESAAQSADSDADGYVDGIEEELGSKPADPDSTPEHFALLWTCTDGNDNDRDGKRDFIDPGCRNTAPGTTPAPTPAPTAPPSNTGGGSTGGGTAGGSTGDASGAESSRSGENVVLGGSDTPIGGGGDASGSGASSDTANFGQDSGVTSDAAAADAAAADAKAAARDENAASEQKGNGDLRGLPWWLLSLLILAAGLVAACVAFALAGRRRSRAAGASARY